MLRSQLIILDHFSTSLLEALALNIPTLCYWAPNFYTYRDSSSEIFKKMLKIEVLHENPASLTKKMKKVWNKISEWWSTPDIQEIINEFRETYVKCDPDYRLQWENAIKALAI